MKRILPLLLTLLALPAAAGFRPTAPNAAEPPEETFHTEADIRRNWEAIRETIAEGNYVRFRNIELYENNLGSSRLTETLRRLKGRPDAHWIDVGAGNGRAAVEGACRYDVRVTAITVEAPHGWSDGRSNPYWNGTAKPLCRNLRTARGRPIQSMLRFLIGRYVEDIPASEMPPAQLVTDVMGAVAYTRQVDQVIDKIGSLMAVDGVALILIPTHSKIFRPDGSRVTWQAWLEASEGLRVVEVLPHGSFILEKTGPVKTKTLRLHELVRGRPPERVYIWDTAPAPPPEP